MEETTTSRQLRAQKTKHEELKRHIRIELRKLCSLNIPCQERRERLLAFIKTI